MAQDFQSITIFGDSLSDSGQLLGLTATEPNPDGSAGMIYVDAVARELGLAVTPSTPLLVPPAERPPPANNYAVVGYRTGSIFDSIVSQSIVDASTVTTVPPGIFRSVRDGYLADPTVTVDPQGLYIVWGGGNDVRDGADSVAAADNVVQGVIALHRAGARHIVVNNVPNIGAVPESGLLGNRETRQADAQTANARLAAGLSASGVNVIQTDVYALLDEVAADPTRYGFGAVDQSSNCYDDAAVTGVRCQFEDPVFGINGASPDPARLLFYDGTHPTQHGQAIIGDYLMSFLEAPGLISILAETPLSSGRAHVRQIEGQLDLEIQGARVRGWRGFVAGEGADNDWNEADYDNDAYQITGGAVYGFDDSWMAGGSLGLGRSDIDFDRDQGGFDQRSLYLSVFGRYDTATLSADALIAFGRLDFDNIERNNLLCAGCRSEQGDTQGNQFLFSLGLRYDLLPQDNSGFGPYLGATYQHVSVDGYQERTSNSSTALRFGGQDQDSLLLSFGLQGKQRFQATGRPVVVQARLLREKELDQDDRTVKAGLRSIPGAGYRLPVDALSQDAWSAGVAVSTELMDGVRAGLGLNWRKGDNDFSEQSIQLGLQFDL